MLWRQEGDVHSSSTREVSQESLGARNRHRHNGAMSLERQARRTGLGRQKSLPMGAMSFRKHAQHLARLEHAACVPQCPIVLLAAINGECAEVAQERGHGRETK